MAIPYRKTYDLKKLKKKMSEKSNFIGIVRRVYMGDFGSDESFQRPLRNIKREGYRYGSKTSYNSICISASVCIVTAHDV